MDPVRIEKEKLAEQVKRLVLLVRGLIGEPCDE
jgi:hypothetical protein